MFSRARAGSNRAAAQTRSGSAKAPMEAGNGVSLMRKVIADIEPEHVRALRAL